VRADIKRKCTWLKRLKNGGAVIAGVSAIVSIGSNWFFRMCGMI
jgi:hypothetical protein